MHKALFYAVKDVDETVNKEPEQLIIYEECEMPLPTNTSVPEKANFYAFRQQLGDAIYDSIIPSYGID